MGDKREEVGWKEENVQGPVRWMDVRGERDTCPVVAENVMADIVAETHETD